MIMIYCNEKGGERTKGTYMEDEGGEVLHVLMRQRNGKGVKK